MAWTLDICLEAGINHEEGQSPSEEVAMGR